MSIETELADYIDQHLDELTTYGSEPMRAIKNAPYAAMKDDVLKARLEVPLKATAQALRGNTEALITFSREGIRPVAQQPGSSPALVGDIGDALYSILRHAAQQAFSDDADQARARAAVAELTFISNRESYTGYVAVREEQLRQREQDFNELQGELEHVSAAVRELSAPIAPIHDNVLVLPLVGSIDTNRAQSITEDLLEEIVARQSDIVIIDITGVPLVDTNIANYLLQTTKAVSLLGAEVILVGISAEIAQTIVGLDIDLRQLVVRANLQDGIAYALEQVGLGILPLDHEHAA